MSMREGRSLSWCPKGNLFQSPVIKKGGAFMILGLEKGYGNRLSSQGFKKGLLIKIFCTGVPPCLQRGDYQGAISSYQGTI